MAPHCVRTIRPTRRSTPISNPKRGNSSAGFWNAAERRAEQPLQINSTTSRNPFVTPEIELEEFLPNAGARAFL
jgi:hypothetical protein